MTQFEGKYKNPPRLQRPVADTLDSIVEMNRPAFDYLCGMRASQSTSYLHATYGDFLLQSGVIEFSKTAAREMERCELTKATIAWFEKHPELDPLLKPRPALSHVVSRTVPKVEKVEPPKVESAEILALKEIAAAAPVRCVLLGDAQEVKKIGIVRSVEISRDSSHVINVDLPLEQRSVRIVADRFASNTPPNWQIVSDDNHEFDKIEGFQKLLDECNRIRLEALQKATLVVDAATEDQLIDNTLPDESSDLNRERVQLSIDTASDLATEFVETSPDGELSIQVEELAQTEPDLTQTQAQEISGSPEVTYPLAKIDAPASQKFKLSSKYSVQGVSFFDLSSIYRKAAAERARFLPLQLEQIPIPNCDYLSLLDRLGESVEEFRQQRQIKSLPHKIKVDFPFDPKYLEVGDVVYSHSLNPNIQGIFLGLNLAADTAALWIVQSKTQRNFLVSALETNWMIVKISDLDRSNCNLEPRIMLDLLQKSIDLRDNPVDPFPARIEVVKQIEEVEEPGQLSSIARGLPSDYAEAAKKNATNKTYTAADDLGKTQEDGKPKSSKKSSKVKTTRSAQKESKPESPKHVRTTLGAEERMVDMVNWIARRVLPLIIAARRDNNWSTLGSKVWKPEELTSFYRVCSHYTGSPKRWYDALILLSQEHERIIGGAITDEEITRIKSQIEEKRRSVISQKNSIYDDAAVASFVNEEMPKLIEQARRTKDWSALTPGNLLSDSRIRRLVEGYQGKPSMQAFVRSPAFGLTQDELDLIDGKIVVPPEVALAEFNQTKAREILPILRRCRMNSDYRELEPEKISQNPKIVAAITYITGAPDRYKAFFRDSRLPFTRGEQRILTAREFTPSRCEEILSTRIIPLVTECRASTPPDYSRLRTLNVKNDRELIGLARYLSASRSIATEHILEHQRVGLSKSELAQIYGELTSDQIEEIKEVKWRPLLDKCRLQNDFSPLRTSLLRQDPDLNALLLHYNRTEDLNVHDTLTKRLGVHVEECEKIANIKYTYEVCKRVLQTQVLPILLECLELNDFKPLSFDALFSDREILGVANNLFKMRPSVEKLLAHPLVGLSQEEAHAVIGGNRWAAALRQREAMRDDLINKVQDLLDEVQLV